MQTAANISNIVSEFAMCNVEERDNGVGDPNAKALFTDVLKTGTVKHQQTVQSRQRQKSIPIKDGSGQAAIKQETRNGPKIKTRENKERKLGNLELGNGYTINSPKEWVWAAYILDKGEHMTKPTNENKTHATREPIRTWHMQTRNQSEQNTQTSRHMTWTHEGQGKHGKWSPGNNTMAVSEIAPYTLIHYSLH